jgi:hypothetical protein
VSTVRARPAVLAVAAAPAVAVLATLSLGSLLAGITGPLPAATAAAASAKASSAGPTWTSYFYPLKVGWTCHEALTTVTSGSETLTVAAVTKTKKGEAITIDEGSSTDVGGTNVPTNAALHYLITTGGQLISVPSAGQLGGQAYHYVGNTVFPSVHTLLAGGSGLSRVHISAPLGKSDLAQIKSILTPHSTSLEMALVLKQSGSKVAQLQTSAGTYHNVLAVRSSLKSLDITNALGSARRDLDREIQPSEAKSVANTVWYAPGFGPVKVVVGGVTSVVTGCGPSASASSTTTTTTTTTTSAAAPST